MRKRVVCKTSQCFSKKNKGKKNSTHQCNTRKSIVPTCNRKIRQRTCNRIKKPSYSLLHKPGRLVGAAHREAEPLPGLLARGRNFADRIRHRPAFRLSKASILPEFLYASWGVSRGCKDAYSSHLWPCLGTGTAALQLLGQDLLRKPDSFCCICFRSGLFSGSF